MARRWSEEEMLVAVYLYRFGQNSLGFDLRFLAKAMDRSVDAIKLRLIDLKAIDKPHENLPGFGGSSELVRVWNYSKDLSREVLKERVDKCLRNIGL